MAKTVEHSTWTDLELKSLLICPPFFSGAGTLSVDDGWPSVVMTVRSEAVTEGIKKKNYLLAVDQLV